METADTATAPPDVHEAEPLWKVLDDIQAALLDLQKTVEEVGLTRNDQLLTRDEAADLLRISKRKLDDLEEMGELQAVRIGRRVLYHPDALRSFVREQAHGAE